MTNILDIFSSICFNENVLTFIGIELWPARVIRVHTIGFSHNFSNAPSHSSRHV